MVRIDPTAAPNAVVAQNYLDPWALPSTSIADLPSVRLGNRASNGGAKAMEEGSPICKRSDAGQSSTARFAFNRGYG